MISNEKALATLQKIWKSEGLKLLGEYDSSNRFNKNSGVLVNVLTNDRKVVYPKPAKNRKVSIEIPYSENLIDGEYYEVHVKVAPIDLRRQKDNPYLLVLDHSKNIVHVPDYKSPDEFIKKWFFEKGHTPDDASTIARQLKLNELELYTHTKRFIFELIQNADDMPRRNIPVDIKIYLTRNHLLFLHNGKFFDRDDVKAICDAAKSTKRSDVTQTGYKGIGFKSVFTDSSTVYIDSGSYSFKFDKNESIYKNFWKLYEGYFNSLNKKARAEVRRKYSGEEEEYLNTDSIPWQIKPIWVDEREYSQELTNSPFNKFDQVKIALDVGEKILNDSEKDYHRMISQLIEEPRFLLFLRHTGSISYQRLYPLNEDKLVKIDIERTPKSIRVAKNGVVYSTYLKQNFDVKLDNADFRLAGLNFQKVKKEDKTVYVDLDGNTLENIPEKLVQLEKTTLSFAAEFNNGEIKTIAKDDSILFNYLPTSDNRFGFNFLVNGDFVSKTDREFIQVENKWNHYLFYQIGYNLINWLSILAREKNRKGFFTNLSSYLNLLPKSLLDELNEEQGGINKAFNNGMREALNEVPFIVSYSKKILKRDEIIVDRTGITNALKNYGGKFFYEIADTSKELPFFLVDDSKLRYKYLDIEHFEGGDLISALRNTENRSELGNILQSLDENNYKSFVKWFDDFVDKNTVDNSLLMNLPILKAGDNILSFNELKSESKFLLRTNRIDLHANLFNRIGIQLTDINIEEYTSLWKNFEGFILSGVEVFDRLHSSRDLHELKPAEKAQLINFISGLEGVGKEKYADRLHLFKDQSGCGLLKPLSKLITNSVSDMPSWLSHMKIDNQEEIELDSKYDPYLLQRKDLLQDLFCASELYKQVIAYLEETELIDFYSFLTELAKELHETDKALVGKTEIPWIYVPTKKKFLQSEVIFLPDSLKKLDEDSYQAVVTIVESISDLKIPVFSSQSLISALSLGTKSVEFTESIHSETHIGKEHVTSFLSWLSDAKEKVFFTKFVIQENGSSYLLKKAERNQQYYTSTDDLVNYIKERDKEQIFRILPEELFTNDLEKAGLLTDENLFLSLIEHGLSDLELVKFFETHIGDNLFQKYLNSIDRIDISTTQRYHSESVIAKVVELASDLISRNVIDANSIRSKIFVDDHQLSDTAISDDIYFKEMQYRPELKLSEVLTDYRDKTYSYSKIREIFPDSTNEILKIIFTPKQLSPRNIRSKLSEVESEILSPEQTFFILMYAHDQNVSDPFYAEKTFTAYFDTNKDKYIESAVSFLDLLLREDGFRQGLNKFKFPDLVPELAILNYEYAVESELPPQWFKEWMDNDPEEKRIEFTKEIGFNHDDSAVVRLRKSILENDSDRFDAAKVELENVQLLINTLVWLQEKQKSDDLKLSDDFLQPLYKKAHNLNCEVKELPIPIFEMNGNSHLAFIDFEEDTQFYKKLPSWTDYTDIIYSFLRESDRFVIPDYMPDKYLEELKAKEIEPTIELNEEEVTEKSKEFQEKYYEEWSRKEELKILVYPEDKLPFNLRFDESVLKQIRQESRFFISDSKVVVSESIKNSIPDVLRSDLFERGLENLFHALNTQKGDWKKKSEKNDGEIKYTASQIKVLNRLFDEDLPEDHKKNYNLAALVSGLEVLESLDYDVEEAYENLKNTHEYSNINPVYKTGDRLEVKCRSAIGGLLYLTKKAWDQLNDSNVELYVDLGGGEYLLLYDKEHVLEESSDDVDFQILRIESKSNISNIEEILSGGFDPGKIWIIFKVKKETPFDPIFIKPDNSDENQAPARTVN